MRRARIAAAVDGLGLVGDREVTGLDAIDAEEPRRYLLVERNVGSAAAEQSHYLTTHTTRADAANYVLGQEYPADWEIVYLLDLDEDQTYTGEVIQEVEWTEA